MQLGIDFYKESEQIFTVNELDEILKNEQKFFIEYAENYWLKRYFKMKLMSTTSHVPSIISTISDMPSGGSNIFNSKTEQYALKSIEAKEWMECFHSKLETLPELPRNIIKLKYLKRREDGKHYTDEVIYPELHISRGLYYQLKKLALEELGRSLYGVFK